MTECHLLEKCGFFSRYGSNKEIDCDKLIRDFCRGPQQAECRRLQYRNRYGVPPSDNMLPDGRMIDLPLLD
jgi:hypothetical protein